MAPVVIRVTDLLCLFVIKRSRRISITISPSRYFHFSH
jgi:hypothetical protein